jgi:hypothetical protein
MIRDAHPGSGSRIRRIRILILPIPDPGSKGQKGTGSRIRNTGNGNTIFVNIADGGNLWEQGLWGEDAAQHVRNITWEVENPRALVDKYAGTVCTENGRFVIHTYSSGSVDNKNMFVYRQPE